MFPSTVPAVDKRFRDIKFEVSETISTLDDASSLCAEAVDILPAGASKYYPCIQGGVLPMERSRLFMVGQFVQLRMDVTPVHDFLVIHVKEVEVHGY